MNGAEEADEGEAPATAPVRPYRLAGPNGTVVVHLLYGVQLGNSERVMELTFHRARGKDMRGMKFVRNADGSTVIDTGLMIDFAARLCRRTPVFMDELEGEDLDLALDVAGDLFMSGRPTGPSS